MTIRRGLALGCGGVLGHAWSTVMLAAVTDALDWDAREAEIIMGTSGGAEIAAALGAGISAHTLVDALTGTGESHPVLSAHLAHNPGKFPRSLALQSGATT